MYNKETFRSSVVVLLIALAAIAAQQMWTVGQKRMEVTARQVTLVDTRTQSHTYKGHTRTESRGMFVDTETKKYFGDDINDRLYTQFVKGELKPIKMSWMTSYDRVHQTSIGDFMCLGAILIWLVSAFFGLYWFIGRRWYVKSDSK